MDLATIAIAATPAFLASAVEFVEATTIVLAVGITRGWRAPLVGSALSALTLALIVGTLGVAIVTVVPEHLLLGIVNEPDGAGGRVLRALGADATAVRRVTVESLAGYQKPDPNADILRRLEAIERRLDQQ